MLLSFYTTTTTTTTTTAVVSSDQGWEWSPMQFQACP